jgi:membrane fusion protein (multidrug efflux system)
MDKRKKIFAVLGTLAVLLGGYFGYRHFVYVETDDAQVQAHFLMLSSRVNGTIQKVLVTENQKVRKGDVLAQIDTSDYSTQSDAAQSQVASLEARYVEAETSFKRAGELLRSQAITQERFDAAQAEYKDVAAKLKQAKAQLDMANLNVSYTKIVAPSDGTIARKSVEPGQFVAMGQPLFGFVDASERWVTANLKETELDQVRPGKPADIDVDALPHHSFHGEVESISPSTGAVFSLLPPDNSTGNFTKVVQRVPVKIRLTGLTPDEVDMLQVGLSAVVSIKVR